MEGIDRKSIWKGLFIAVALSVATLMVILFLTIDSDTWDAVSDVSPVFLFAAFALLLIRWAAHVARTKLLVKASGAELGWWETTKSIMAGSFAGHVTPFRAAGIPVDIFFLYTYGIPGPQATAVITAGSTMSILLFVLAMPVIFAATAARVDVHIGIRSLLVVAGIVALLLLLLVVYSMRDPARAASFFHGRAPARLREKSWYDRGVDRFLAAIADFSRSLRLIVGYGKGTLLLAGGLTVVLWTSVLFIPPLILWSLGHPELFWQAVLAQLIVSYLLPFMPVPGESGMAEATFAGVYAVFVPGNLVGVLALAWRFFTFYLALLVTGVFFVVAFRDVGRVSPGESGSVEDESEEEDEEGGEEDARSGEDENGRKENK